MSTEVISDAQSVEPLLRKKALTAISPGTMRTDIDCGDFGSPVTDDRSPMAAPAVALPRCRRSWSLVRM